MKLQSVILLLGTAVSMSAGAPFEFDEVDFDFVDHDIGNMPGSSVSDCFTKCTTTFKSVGCKAVSFYQGVCYFKSGRDQVIRKAGVTSTAVYDTVPNVCSPLEGDTDYVGNDIANVGADSHQCCGLCRDYPGCRAFSWNNYKGGTCWLKSGRGMIIHKKEVYSGLAYPAPDVDHPHYVEVDTDYSDHDIGNRPSGTADGCFDICHHFAGCNAFAWNNYKGGTCWLKSTKSNPFYKAGVISAVVNANPVEQCGFIGSDTDIYEHDIADISGISNPEDCCGLCAANPDCQSYSWNTYKDGTCWFKDAVVDPNDKMKGTIHNYGVTSYFVIRSPTPTPTETEKPTPRPTPTPTPSATTETPTPTSTPNVTTEAPTPTPTPNVTETPAPSVTPTETPTPSETTAAPSVTPSETPTPSETTAAPSVTLPVTPAPSETTAAPSATPTETPVPTPSANSG